MAPGTHIEGAASRAAGYNGLGVCNQYWPASQTLYAWSSGTSHSTPGVAGACALVRQYFVNHSIAAPSPAMLKAYLECTSTYMTGVGANDTLPSNNQGMGASTKDGVRCDGQGFARPDASARRDGPDLCFERDDRDFDRALPRRARVDRCSRSDHRQRVRQQPRPRGDRQRHAVPRQRLHWRNLDCGRQRGRAQQHESVFLPTGTTGSYSITVRATNIAGDGVPGNGDSTDQDFALVVYNSGACPDTDGDGVNDCLDGCPNDPNKTTPGICGCGVADTDSDGDGTPNCNDGCPSDPLKTAAGVCGCGVADTDSDGDGTPTVTTVVRTIR